MDEQVKKIYEVSFLARSENGAAVMVEHLITVGGEIINEGGLNKMKLAYPIEKEESAYFGCITCSIPTEMVSKVHDAVRLDKEILRLMILVPTVVKKNAGSKKASYTSEPSREGVRSKVSSVEIKEKSAISNELLEEKLEEILK